MISLDAMPIPLFGGRGFAWVDQQDMQAVSERRWSLLKDPKSDTAYAIGSINTGKRTVVTMHRFIAARAGLNVSRQVDHIDRNGLNNTRQNLRAASPSQNQANRALQKSNSTGFKGMSRHSDGGWQTRMAVGKRRIFMGIVHDLESAARIYDEWAWDAWGEFAWLNFPRTR